jgi:hypothetical protein
MSDFSILTAAGDDIEIHDGRHYTTGEVILSAQDSKSEVLLALSKQEARTLARELLEAAGGSHE